MSVEADLVEAIVARTDKAGRVDRNTVLRMREDKVSPYMRKMLPRRSRVNVPLLNSLLLRETGNILAGLGQRLMVVSRSEDLDEEAQLRRALSFIREAQTRILYLSGGKSVLVKMLDDQNGLNAEDSE